MDCPTLRILLQKAFSYKSQFCTKVHVFKYLQLCVSSSTCVFKYLCLQVCVSSNICVFKYVCLQVSVSSSMCVFKYVCLQIYVSSSMCVFKYVCLQICVPSHMCVVKYVHLQLCLSSSMCVFKAGLSNLIDGWAKYKVKVLDMSDSNQNVETICNFELKFAELKDLFLKRV